MRSTTQLYPAQGWRHPQGIRVVLGKLYQGTSHRLSVASNTYWPSIANKVDKLGDQDGLPYFLIFVMLKQSCESSAFKLTHNHHLYKK